MELKRLYIKNFRNLEEISLNFSSFNVLIGENNIGKTNIIMAIYKILRFKSSPSRITFNKDDFFYDKYNDKRAEEIIIQLTFGNLTEEDQAAFAWEGIDTEEDEINVMLKANWEEENEDANVNVFFYREEDENKKTGENFKLSHKKNIPFYYIDAYRDVKKETSSAKGDLKQLFKFFNKHFLKPTSVQSNACIKKIDAIVSKIEDQDEGFIKILQDMKEIFESDDLEKLEEKLTELENTEKPDGIEEESVKKIKEKINNIIVKIKLDEKKDEIQSTVDDLDGFSKIKQTITDNLSLFLPEHDMDINLGEIDESILFNESNIHVGEMPILMQGSGHQSSFVIALKISRLLTELEYSEGEFNNLLIAMEEPEAHTHPHLQRSLINSIKQKQNELYGDGKNVQFIVTTHSPFILSQLDLSDIRLLRSNGKVKSIHLNDEFLQDEIISEISENKLKHFDKLYRMYPEIFLSRGVIIVEGDTEFGAFPEFAKIMEDVDLDKNGLTIVNGGSVNSVKYLYKIIKSFSNCIAIIDDEGDQEDEYLADDPDELYFITDYQNYEEELFNSVDKEKLIKIFIKSDVGGTRLKYVDFIRRQKNKYKKQPVSFILSNLNDCIDGLNISDDVILDTLEEGCKNALSSSMIASELKEEEIPDVYKTVLKKAIEMVD